MFCILDKKFAMEEALFQDPQLPKEPASSLRVCIADIPLIKENRMKTFQRISCAVILGLMLGLSCFADDPPIEPPPVCGHMDTGKCTPSGYTSVTTSDTNGGTIDSGSASSITDAALSFLQSVLPLF